MLALTLADGSPTIDVEVLLRRGYRLLDDWSSKTHDQAEQVFRQALRTAGELAAAGHEMEARLGLAQTLAIAGKCDAAVPLLEEVVTRTRSSSDWGRLAIGLVQLSQCLVTQGQIDRAEDLVNEILVDTHSDFPLGKVNATLGLGDVHYFRGHFSIAEALYRDALEQSQMFGDVGGIVDARLNLGYAMASQSRDQEAKEQLREALHQAQAVGDRRRKATALRALGNVHLRLSEHYEAIRYLELAQTLFEVAGDDASLAILYNALGEVHRRLNDLSTSLDYFRKATESAHRTGVRHVEGAALIETGKCLRLLSRFDEAIEAYEKAQAIFRETGFKAMEGGANAGLGNVYAQRRKFDVAINYLRDALEIKIDAGDSHKASEILNDLADVYVSMGRFSEAIDSSRRAVEYSREPPELIQEGRALATLASISRIQGDLDTAKRYFELALDVDEEMRLRIPSTELRALSFQAAQERYASYIELLLQLGHERADARYEKLALEALERSRSRALLDSVRNARRTNPPQANGHLIEREARLRDQVRTLALRSDLEQQPTGEAEPISDLLAELRRVRALLYAVDDPSSESVKAHTLGAAEIEARFTREGTLLLEYFFREPKSYLWVVGRGRFEVHELPPEGFLQGKIADVYGLLIARQSQSTGSTFEQATRLRELDGRFYRESLLLARELLGGVSDLDAFQRLVIVADGALNYLPISALPHPKRSGDDADTYLPLVATHEIVRPPSVTAMAAMESRAEGRSAKSPIAILADPVFTADDPRVDAGEPSASRDPQEVVSSLEANLRGSGRTLASLPRLLASREELASIASIAPQAATTATDFMADRATAERLLRESYRVVHFATHGVLNDRYPELSGIVLSLVDDQGRPRDGFLRVQDIYGIHIEADLVVLSACETALGHVLRGEGITGLVTALMNAGAGSVVASKWKVDDLATRQLMEEFYRGLFINELNSAAAPRAAQVSLWKRKRTRAPFYWGAFELHGTS